MQVLIVGCGRMGQRYAEALNRMAGPIKLSSVDPQGSALPDADHFLSLEDVPERKFDLAIDAATNINRAERFSWFIDHGIKRVVIEKPHAQSLAESAAMLTLAQASDTEVLIPFYRRFADHYSPASLAALGAGKLTSVVINSGAIGLGCNGVHFLDLANFLFDEMPVSLFADLEMNSIASPRGEQFSDFGGTILMNYPAGKCLLNVDAHTSRGVVVDLSFEYGKITLHKQHEAQWFWYRRDNGAQDGPLTRTHLEKRVEPAHGLDLDLARLIDKGLTALLTHQAYPGLGAGHLVLNQIQTALESNREQRLLPFVLRDRGPDAFSFT